MPEAKPTWTSLAEHTGLSTTTLRTLRDGFGAPKTPDPDEWDKWLSDHPEHGIGGNRVSKDREHWLTQQAEYRAKLLAIEHQKAEGAIVYKSDLDARDVRIAIAQKSALYEILTTELPVKSEGKTALEIRALNRDAADRVCAVMQQRLAEWSEVENEE
jgi:hypothetical protein